jgi:Cys-tRNA(Pro)/Cys-tRNA(Cys) deacylase
MTPAINAAKKAKIDFNIHEYAHDPKSDSYGEEAAEKLGLDPNLVFKTLIVSNEKKELFVAVVPVSCQLNLKLLAKVTGSKKISMAEKNIATRTTGYVLGGVSPLGQKKKLTTVIDESATDFETIFVSAGRRGLEIELAPDDLGSLTRGRFASITNH